MARKGRPPLKRQRLLNAAQERDDMSSDEEVFQADTEPEDEDLGAVDMPSIMLANVEDTAASPDAQPSVQSLPIEPEQQSVPPGAGAEAGRVLLLFDVTETLAREATKSRDAVKMLLKQLSGRYGIALFSHLGAAKLQAAFNRLWRRAFNKKFKKGGDDDNIVQFLMPEVTANVVEGKLKAGDTMGFPGDAIIITAAAAPTDYGSRRLHIPQCVAEEDLADDILTVLTAQLLKVTPVSQISLEQVAHIVSAAVFDQHALRQQRVQSLTGQKKALTKAARKAQAKLEKAKRKVAKAAHERSTEASSAQNQAATSLSKYQALGYAILGNLQVFNEAGGASLSVLCSYLEVICGEAYEKLFSLSRSTSGSTRVMQLAQALVEQDIARVQDVGVGNSNLMKWSVPDEPEHLKLENEELQHIVRWGTSLPALHEQSNQDVVWAEEAAKKLVTRAIADLQSALGSSWAEVIGETEACAQKFKSKQKYKPIHLKSILNCMQKAGRLLLSELTNPCTGAPIKKPATLRLHCLQPVTVPELLEAYHVLGWNKPHACVLDAAQRLEQLQLAAAGARPGFGEGPPASTVSSAAAETAAAWQAVSQSAPQNPASKRGRPQPPTAAEVAMAAAQSGHGVQAPARWNQDIPLPKCRKHLELAIRGLEADDNGLFGRLLNPVSQEYDKELATWIKAQQTWQKQNRHRLPPPRPAVTRHVLKQRLPADWSRDIQPPAPFPQLKAAIAAVKKGDREKLEALLEAEAAGFRPEVAAFVRLQQRRAQEELVSPSLMDVSKQDRSDMTTFANNWDSQGERPPPAARFAGQASAPARAMAAVHAAASASPAAATVGPQAAFRFAAGHTAAPAAAAATLPLQLPLRLPAAVPPAHASAAQVVSPEAAPGMLPGYTEPAGCQLARLKREDGASCPGDSPGAGAPLSVIEDRWAQPVKAQQQSQQRKPGPSSAPVEAGFKRQRPEPSESPAAAGEAQPAKRQRLDAMPAPPPPTDRRWVDAYAARWGGRAGSVAPATAPGGWTGSGAPPGAPGSWPPAIWGSVGPAAVPGSAPPAPPGAAVPAPAPVEDEAVMVVDCDSEEAAAGKSPAAAGRGAGEQVWDGGAGARELPFAGEARLPCHLQLQGARAAFAEAPAGEGPFTGAPLPRPGPPRMQGPSKAWSFSPGMPEGPWPAAVLPSGRPTAPMGPGVAFVPYPGACHAMLSSAPGGSWPQSSHQPGRPVPMMGPPMSWPGYYGAGYPGEYGNPGMQPPRPPPCPPSMMPPRSAALPVPAQARVAAPRDGGSAHLQQQQGPPSGGAPPSTGQQQRTCPPQVSPGSTAATWPARPGSHMSLLHDELVRFAEVVATTKEESEAVTLAVDTVARVVRLIWPHARTVLFGSQATSLALPGSDLDIVVLGVTQDLARAGTGFTKDQQRFLVELLEDLLDCLVSGDMVLGEPKIIQAKVPIIKARLDIGGGLPADISLAAANGAAAVQLIKDHIQSMPCLKPLVLVLKAFLKEAGLNEVFTGGLSSYSLVLMAVAHMKADPSADLGDLLIGFLRRFGAGSTTFDYVTHAVSLQQGGFKPKNEEWKQAARPQLLAVEDPQEAGRDIGSGSFNIKAVAELFSDAAEALEAKQAGAVRQGAVGGEAQLWATVQADGHSQSVTSRRPGYAEQYPILGSILTVDLAVARDAKTAKARADLASGVHKRAAKMNGQLQLRSWRDLPSWAHGPMPLRSGAHSQPSSVAAGGHARGAAASQAQENAVASLHPAQEEGRKAARTTKRTTREAHQTALRANLQKVLVGTKGTPQHLQTMLSRNQATAGRARRPTRRGGKRKKPARTAAAAARDHS